MNKVTHLLDTVAEALEVRGELDLAQEIDILAAELDMEDVEEGQDVEDELDHEEEVDDDKITTTNLEGVKDQYPTIRDYEPRKVVEE